MNIFANVDNKKLEEAKNNELEIERLTQALKLLESF